MGRFPGEAPPAVTHELILCRHGKTSKEGTSNDRDRPLGDRGKRQSQQLGSWLQRRGALPDRVLAAPFERTLTGAAKCCKAAGQTSALVHAEAALAGDDLSRLLALLRAQPESVHRLMVFGHKRGLLKLLESLSDEHPMRALKKGSLVRLGLGSTWRRLGEAPCPVLDAVAAKALPALFPYPGGELPVREWRERPAYYYTQSAVIPYRCLDDRLEVLVIASSAMKHWLVPKGIVEPGLTPAESARKEAREEAGIEGVVDPRPLGCFDLFKWGADCRCEVYGMRVTEELPEEEWEESHRVRRWCTPEKAASLVRESALADLLRQFRIL